MLFHVVIFQTNLDELIGYLETVGKVSKTSECRQHIWIGPISHADVEVADNVQFDFIALRKRFPGRYLKVHPNAI